MFLISKQLFADKCQWRIHLTIDPKFQKQCIRLSGVEALFVTCTLLLLHIVCIMLSLFCLFVFEISYIIVSSGHGHISIFFIIQHAPQFLEN